MTRTYECCYKTVALLKLYQSRKEERTEDRQKPIPSNQGAEFAGISHRSAGRQFCMEFKMCQASNKNRSPKVVIPFKKSLITLLFSQIQVCQCLQRSNAQIVCIEESMVSLQYDLRVTSMIRSSSYFSDEGQQRLLRFHLSHYTQTSFAYPRMSSFGGRTTTFNLLYTLLLSEGENVSRMYIHLSEMKV